jgi:hypothetical protein
MKRKLTLTIEGGVTHRAKTLARRRGKSLSQLVEELLERETDETAPTADSAPFSRRWAGKMELAEREDPRFRKLTAKYDLETGK